MHTCERCGHSTFEMTANALVKYEIGDDGQAVNARLEWLADDGLGEAAACNDCGTVYDDGPVRTAGTRAIYFVQEAAKAIGPNLTEDVRRNWRIVIREIDRRAIVFEEHPDSQQAMYELDSYRTENGEDALDFVRAMIGPLD